MKRILLMEMKRTTKAVCHHKRVTDFIICKEKLIVLSFEPVPIISIRNKNNTLKSDLEFSLRTKSL